MEVKLPKDAVIDEKYFYLEVCSLFLNHQFGNHVHNMDGPYSL